MKAVIQLSYILRGLLRAAKPTYKNGHSLNIYILLFCWSFLLKQGIYLLKYFASI
jgi:cytochrome c oxidase subunit IV